MSKIEVLGLIDNRDDALESPVRSIFENIATREEVIKCSINYLETHFISAMQ